MKKYLILLVLLSFSPYVFAAPVESSRADVPETADIGEYVLKDEFVSDLDGCGQEEKAALLYRDIPEMFTNFTLQVKKAKRTFDLDSAILAPKDQCILEEIVISPEHKPLIGISYPTGGHSEWLGIYSFDGKTLSEVNNLFSDRPSIVIKDVDDDGVKDIEIINRDNENDPSEDSYIKIYKYKDGKFKTFSVYRTKTGTYLPEDKIEE
ncbi:MAG: hypothetical protein ABIG55_04945 [Candidatus Omnitrophota bacterium]|nr:hypothetical protein [Candidatus Omnitrophota bacterium]